MGIATLLTREEFLALPDADDYELIDGELKEREMNMYSSGVGLSISSPLFVWNEQAGLGKAFQESGGLDIFQRNYVPRPDGGWISFARLGAEELPRGPLQVPPELVFEVVSTHDNARLLDRKVRDYLAAGIDIVWVAYPETRRLYVFHRNGDTEILRESDTLTADLLPGFALPLARVFPPES